MDNAVETLDSIINQFKDFKLDIFNNKISSQTIKNSAYNLKALINKISDNESVKKMLKSEDLKAYYEDKYLSALNALEKLETEKQSFHSEKKNSYRNENNQLGILKSDSTSKKHPKIRKFTSPLKEISNNIGLMEFEDSHFVPEKEYKSILNEIKLLEGEINNLEVEKNLKQQKIKQCESDCLLNEAELKEFINDNTRLRKELEDNHNQSITFLQKNSEVEMELKKNSEKLSFAQHKEFYLQKINKELSQNWKQIQEEIKKIKEENETGERLYQAKIKEINQNNKEKQWDFYLTRKNSLRASITPNKTNIIISDKADTIFFKAKIVTPEETDNIRSFNEGLNNTEISQDNNNQTPYNIFKKVSCFDEELVQTTIFEVGPSHEKTNNTDLLITQHSDRKKVEKDRSCGCFDFGSILHFCS